MTTPKATNPPPAVAAHGDEKATHHAERSPNYPAIGFKRAVELARKVYQAEKKHPMSKELAVKHMGYTYNGRSKLILSALKKYGLMDSDSDKFKISDAAFAIMVYPVGHPERVKQEKALAMGPKMFKQVLAKFPEGLPSDENLKASLQVEEKFTLGAADTFIATLREAMAVAGIDDGGETRDIGDTDAADDAPEEAADMEQAENVVQQSGQRQSPPAKPGMISQEWDLGGDVLAKLHFSAKPNAKQIEVLKRYVEILAATRED